jgi:hypothetical protein
VCARARARVCTGRGIEQKDKGRGVENLRHPDGDPQFFDLVLNSISRKYLLCI